MIFLCLCYVFIMYVILLGYLVYSEFQTWPWCHPNFSFEYCKVTNPMDLWIFWLGVKWLGRFYIYIYWHTTSGWVQLHSVSTTCFVWFISIIFYPPLGECSTMHILMHLVTNSACIDYRSWVRCKGCSGHS